MRLALAISCLGLVVAAPASAACDDYSFEGSVGYSAARVKAGAGKTRFMDENGAPQPAYLLPGDEVVVMAKEGDRACAVYVSKTYDETIGWLPLAKLQPVPAAKGIADWRGTFVRDQLGSQAVLKPLKDGRVDATVEAYWAMSLETAKTGGINEGGLGGEAAVKDGALYIPPAPADNNNCEANLRRIGTRYLLVEDNRTRLGEEVLTCAGHNVTFTGLYVRTK